jgi:hypothetical protein
MKIYKYPLNIDKEQVLKMPMGARILTVHTQSAGVYLWAMVDARHPMEDRYFSVVVTGEEIEDASMKDAVYLGTFHFIDSKFNPVFVGHVFEVHKPSGGNNGTNPA